MYVQTIVKQIIITGSEGAGLCNISLFQRKGISFCHSFYFFLNIVSFDKNTHDPWQKTSQEKKKKKQGIFFLCSLGQICKMYNTHSLCLLCFPAILPALQKNLLSLMSVWKMISIEPSQMARAEVMD